jgi:carbamoyl-phosphate synthase large subunit
MPKRTDLHTILLIGSGPIVTGQACEFDYSGTQACKALKEEGYRVVVVNSNPATIMTDPGLVDATYIEPITPHAVEQIIIQERPDALLPTMGGQTALNMAMRLAEDGILEKHGVQLIGATPEVIRKAEDRDEFRKAMQSLGFAMPTSTMVAAVEDALAFAETTPYPLIVRPSFTMGGAGGGIAHNPEQLRSIVSGGLTVSPTSEVLVEQSILDWKEYELEVMRDHKDNVVIICSIENFDPVGVHTGDSITVVPAQTLSDREYQALRDMSLAIMREIGVDTGGSNVQFAVHPETGEVMVIELNPRVSRSSALASKATGFPIAKITAKLAVGYTLDEIPNDITHKTPACFEPSLDYVVTKIPRFTFEKFSTTPDLLGTQMQSVGEVMAIGRTFRESFQKALRSLETGTCGLDEPDYSKHPGPPEAVLEKLLQFPSSQSIWFVADAFRHGWSDERLHQFSHIDPWFLAQIRSLVTAERNIRKTGRSEMTPVLLRNWKRLGFSDERLAFLLGITTAEISKLRREWNILPVYKLVDTCAAEFPSETPYFYSTYEDENESLPTDAPKVLILGSGPNRIGQGIEFDYCCVHAAFALRELGYEAIMLNCNPETVSTDYDTSDRLYFEPVTFEDVMHVVELERPLGVIVQLGGQTPLKLAKALKQAGVRLLGTPFRSIDRAEDRAQFAGLLRKLDLKQPRNGMARSLGEAVQIGNEIGYPLLLRPSYVLGGRAMMVASSEEQLKECFAEALNAAPEHPVLIDEFLVGAIEVDADFIGDGEHAELGGIMEHIEAAGVHSGDSACVLPPHQLSPEVMRTIEEQGRLLALALKVCGLMNVQFAVKDGEVYIIEVNPRASRTVPFVSKASGQPLAKYATRLMLGATLEGLGYRYTVPDGYSVKKTVFSFACFAEADAELAPEMRSTGEVMGRGKSFEEAYMKAQAAVYSPKLSNARSVFIGMRGADKAQMVLVAQQLVRQGYRILATAGTADVLEQAGIADIQCVHMQPGQPDSLQGFLHRGEVALLINTTRSRKRKMGATHIRRLVLHYNLPYCTTVEGAQHYVQSFTKFGTLDRFRYVSLPMPEAS